MGMECGGVWKTPTLLGVTAGASSNQRLQKAANRRVKVPLYMDQTLCHSETVLRRRTLELPLTLGVTQSSLVSTPTLGGTMGTRVVPYCSV